ncbi:hypothetical protein N8510_03120, partial [bacterium]|nr:hypothetical protein [bacterium]
RHASASGCTLGGVDPLRNPAVSQKQFSEVSEITNAQKNQPWNPRSMSSTSGLPEELADEELADEELADEELADQRA